MDAAKRLEILDWVMHLTDETVFNKLLSIKDDAHNEDEIVAYTVLGEPMNREQYYAKIKQGEKDIEEGRFTTQEDLRKEMESW